MPGDGRGTVIYDINGNTRTWGNGIGGNENSGGASYNTRDSIRW